VLKKELALCKDRIPALTDSAPFDLEGYPLRH